MTKETQLAKVASSPFDLKQIELIKNTVAKGATNDELKLFLYTASRTGLDPLTKQIHFVKRNVKKIINGVEKWEGQMTIQTGIDGYRVIAQRSGVLAGIDDAIYDDETKDHPKKASVTVYKMVEGEKVSFTASARWAEYAPTGNQAFMWNKMPFLMLGKVAEALALRKAFPNDLTGLYTTEEMDQADSKPVLETKLAESVYKKPVEEPVEVKEPEAVTGEVVEEKKVIKTSPLSSHDDPTGAANEKKCPSCNRWHTGLYPKCKECYFGNTKQTPKTKVLVNEKAAPFEN